MSSTPYTTTNTVTRNLCGATETLAFFEAAGATIQTVAAYSGDTLTSSSPYGFSSKAKGDELIAKVEAMHAALKAYGILK